MVPLVAPVDVPALVCHWQFQEPPGEDRVAAGPCPYRLHEQAGPIERVEGGVFGPYALRLREGQWLNLPRAECPALNFHGPRSQVTVVAWLKRHRTKGNHCEAVAGMWNETRRLRQYCLFLNLGIWRSANQVCAHVSSVGGPTPGYKYCMDAAIGLTPVTLDTWHCVAISYDGTLARAYLDGRLDSRGDRNPYRYEGGLFDGGADGADFTVGAVHRSNEMGNYFAGVLGGLAVWERALRDEEIARLAGVPPPG